MTKRGCNFRVIGGSIGLIVLIFSLIAWQNESVHTPDSRVRQIYLSLDPYESNDGTQFWIRVTEHPEIKKLSFIAGAYYVFESGSSESGPWKNIMTVHLDDPDPIPTSNVVFVNSRMGYVFLYDKLAVTTDAGLTWSSWELAQGNKDWKPKNAIIRSVLLANDGTGVLKAEIFASGNVVSLHTEDFGRNWHPVQTDRVSTDKP